MSNPTPEPAPDAGINALRLDADRARDDLERTLHEIETRLNPQRVIQPVLRAVRSVQKSYTDNPVRFVAVVVGVVGGFGALIVLSYRSGNADG